MFDSDLLDRLSRVHPMIPPAIFVPAICVLFAVGARELTTAGTIGLVLAGWLFWTLTEYWLHRLVFHFEPQEGPGARLHWIIHGVHHDHPNDPLRLVMPPSVSVPLAAAFYGLFVLVIGTPAADVFASGFLTGYLIYDMTHFYVHHRKPKHQAGQADPRAAHAPSLPGRHAWLRRERTVLGLRVRHLAGARQVASEALVSDTAGGCGGIGRRAAFRSPWGQPRGGSSPLSRTPRSTRCRPRAVSGPTGQGRVARRARSGSP